MLPYKPRLWERVLTTPIPKLGKDKNMISGYRPISTSSAASKIIEKHDIVKKLSSIGSPYD